MAKRIRVVYICDICQAYGKPETLDVPSLGIFKSGLLPGGWSRFGKMTLCPHCTKKANRLCDIVDEANAELIEKVG